MTIENASSFLAWDVSSYLAVFLIMAFIIVVTDHFFMGGSVVNAPTTKKSLLGKWLYFVCFLKLNKSKKYLHRSKIVQLSAEFYPMLLLIFALRGFIVEPFRIPSNSMMPTFLTYDFLLVDKISYGIHLPILNTELLDIGDPERGDVVVFRYPNYEKRSTYKGADFIKRVIGLPGDKIEYINDQLTVNGEAVEYKKIGTYSGIEKGIEMTGYRHVRELLGDNPHDVLLHPRKNSRSVRLVVPQGHYFVMGDNRANSSDSRFWGFVPEKYIIGRAFYIWAHGDIGGLFSSSPLKALKTFTFSRNGVID
ncbi:signal peptidase I [Bathymodiolus septemdierum thioautotrophic gill symbiont]|uniref:Signal peptidase I n=1 Tax=endosymbiont of Bathymodiolus septemdierum str. Myojin knoll TaxID=1303921 RepID=A0A0P0URA8_9GAMM|nr:signal peptidase I [Bathymodiolus septemdierum thioautotrophic gill symbiont]BAS67768.1 signal peptidase I [endosymbiont of Bathymodiolus septemdierum str. Myojin knoll]